MYGGDGWEEEVLRYVERHPVGGSLGGLVEHVGAQGERRRAVGFGDVFHGTVVGGYEGGCVRLRVEEDGVCVDAALSPGKRRALEGFLSAGRRVSGVFPHVVDGGVFLTDFVVELETWREDVEFVRRAGSGGSLRDFEGGETEGLFLRVVERDGDRVRVADGSVEAAVDLVFENETRAWRVLEGGDLLLLWHPKGSDGEAEGPVVGSDSVVFRLPRPHGWTPVQDVRGRVVRMGHSLVGSEWNGCVFSVATEDGTEVEISTPGDVAARVARCVGGIRRGHFVEIFRVRTVGQFGGELSGGSRVFDVSRMPGMFSVGLTGAVGIGELRGRTDGIVRGAVVGVAERTLDVHADCGCQVREGECRGCRVRVEGRVAARRVFWITLDDGEAALTAVATATEVSVENPGEAVGREWIAGVSRNREIEGPPDAAWRIDWVLPGEEGLAARVGVLEAAVKSV